MALLSSIPEQDFEKIRDRIGTILFDEFQVQTIIPKIFNERTVAFDKIDIPCINVVLASGEPSQRDPSGTRTTYRFNIDAYASNKTTSSNRADYESTKKLHRMIAVIKQVFLNPVYRTLLFAPPSLSHVNFVNFAIAEPIKKDGITMTMARVVFDFEVFEGNELKDSTQATDVLGRVKLHETDEGFQYISM